MTRIRIDKGFGHFIEGKALGYLMKPRGSDFGAEVPHVVLALDSGQIVVEPIEPGYERICNPTVRPGLLRRALNWSMGFGPSV